MGNTELRKFIDVKGAIASKSPALVKMMPRFVLNFIRRTMHEEELNQILARYQGVTGLEFVRRLVHDECKIQPILHGFENVPNTGRFIFIANHPWGAMEAVTLMDIVAQKYPELRFIVNDLLMMIKNYEPLFLPVNKHGAQARENARILDENFASDKQILIFPAGMVSRMTKGQVMDPPWQKSFVSKAVQYQRDIIPIYIDGRNSNFFYNLYKFRKAIHLKANLEMFYLVDEMFKNMNKSLPYYFGKPISYQVFDKRKTKQEWANSLKTFVYSLKEDHNKIYEPDKY